ncbi:MAG: DUF3782 domain-containing protein [Desulfobacterales bacterium]|nr:DUF3782 domain-containing protein [Desulfobacterales bacterium]
MQTQTSEEIKKIIIAEVPRLMESDPDIRRFILDITHEKYADRIETESRIDRILDELKRDREARDRKWETQEKKWEAQEKKWEENQKVINEILIEIKAHDRRFDSTIGALGARWGLRSERAFRDGLKAILEKSFGVKVERYEDYDHDGLVFGRPDQVELDVIIHNETLILCEIKSSMSKSEMYAFWRKKNFYENKHARKASRVMVISPMIDHRASAVAKDLDIEVYGYAEDVRI